MDVPFSGKAIGRDDSTKLVGANFAKIETQVPVVVDVVAQGDTVIVTGRERGRLQGADSDYAIEWVQRFRLNAEKVINFRQVFTTLEPNSDHQTENQTRSDRSA